MEKYTKELCREIALKFQTRKQLCQENRWVYQKVIKKGWHELFSHMHRESNSYHRCLYLYDFGNNEVYIGLTYSLESRHRGHKSSSKSRVNQHAKKIGFFPEIQQITPFMQKEKASKLEIEKIKEYRSRGYVVINKKRGGGLGGSQIKWTKEKCFAAAKKCETKMDFNLKFGGAREAARKNGWLDEIHLLFPEIIKEKGFWTKEKCLHESLKYQDKKSFRKGNIAAYNMSNRNGWMDEITLHMNLQDRPKGFWTKERCREVCRKYNTRTSMRKEEQGLYKACKKNGWLDEFYPITKVKL